MHPNACLFLSPLERHLFEAFGLKNTSAESLWKTKSLSCVYRLQMVLFYLILFNEATFAHLSCKQSRLRTCFVFSPKRILANQQKFRHNQVSKISAELPRTNFKGMQSCSKFNVLMVLNAIGSIGQVGTTTHKNQTVANARSQRICCIRS